MTSEELLNTWRETLQIVTEKVSRYYVSLPTELSRGIARQYGDNWEESDRIIDHFEKVHNDHKMKILERLAQWTPPAEAEDLNAIIDAAIVVVNKYSYGLGPYSQEAITAFLENARPKPAATDLSGQNTPPKTEP